MNVVKLESDDQGHQTAGEEVVSVAYRFKCASCGAGGSHYSGIDDPHKEPQGVFKPDGTCRHCGSPAEPIAIAAKFDKETIRHSVLLIAEDDMQPQIEEIERVLGVENKINVINAQKIIEGDNPFGGVTTGNLAYLMSQSAYILVVMSPVLKTNSIVGTCLSEATRPDFPHNSIEVDDDLRMIPVFTTPESYDVKIRQLADNWSVCDWNEPQNKDETNNFSRPRLIADIKKTIAAVTPIKH